VDYLRRIWKLRYFWGSLVRTDVARRYRHSFLGIGWSLVRPLGLTVLFCGVFGQLFAQDVAEYAPYLLMGLTLWQFLSESALIGCHCFQHGGVYLRQQPLPLAIFPLRVVLGTGFHAAIALALAVTLVVCLKGPPPVTALASLVPGMLLLFLLGWFVAMLCGLLHAHFPDTHHLLELVLQVVFYLTPILYPPDSLRQRLRLAWLFEINPLGCLLEMVRAPLVGGEVPPARAVLLATAFVACVGVIACAALRRCERTLIYWI
jgi:lipopolysaccharide transport system permease protein